MDPIDQLDNRAREWTLNRTGTDPTPEIEAAISAARGIDLARLHMAHAAAVQSHNPLKAADDGVAAAAIFVRHGMLSDAAAASALAAGMAEIGGDWPRSIEHAVAAMVQLTDSDIDDEQSARAALALSMFYGHMAAFELAMPFARRAVDTAMHLGTSRPESAVFNAGYVSLEALHAGVADDAQRIEWRATVDDAIALLHKSDDTITSQLVATSLEAEAHLLDGNDDAAAVVLAGSEELIDDVGPLFRPWVLFVRACVARRSNELAAAEALLTEALPGLEATADDHCLVRALAERALVRELAGDLTGALADTRTRAELVRRWQVDRIEQFAQLVATQAELRRDGTRLRQQAGELVRAATEDPLTGLFSRRWLTRRIVELETLDRGGAVLLVDIDHFKLVNDTYGHGVGDKVLAAIGDVLQASFRDGDVVRYGGEEFLVSLLVDPLTAQSIAERARMAIAHAAFDDIVPDLRLTISIGVAAGPMGRVRELIDAADDALYVAKQSGRNRVVAADPLT
ncbi:MAG: GGDEF domain-containing protein [Actinomycetota bacterium]